MGMVLIILCLAIAHIQCSSFAIHLGCEPKELLMEFKLLAEVLDYLESNLMTVGTQVFWITII